ncbi:MAG: ATP-binding protein [Chloroflexota bacterium]
MATKEADAENIYELNGATPSKEKIKIHHDTSDILGSHAFARQILRSVFVGQVIIDHDLIVMNTNRAAELLLSQPGQTLIGQHCATIFPENICDILKAKENRSVRIPYTARPIGSSPIPIEITTSKLALEGKTYSHILITALSEKFGLLSSLIQTQRLANIGTLTTSIIHELTNPMSAVATAAATLIQYLENDTFDEEKFRRLGDSIQRNTDRCRTIIDVIRQHIHTNPSRELCQIGDLINNALHLINNRSRTKHNLIIEKFITPGLPGVRVNPNQITQVLINLLLNAEDALGTSGGIITIRAREIPEIGSISISVEDTGTGVAPEIIDEIFEPFFTTKPNHIGMGMGLYISAEIARLHRGWLKAQNLMGKGGQSTGAKFTLLLPIR